MCGKRPSAGLPKQGARGLYALIIRIASAQQLSIGRLGQRLLPPGVYVYVGSAMGEGAQSLRGRIQRHLSASKRMHWHIDALLAAPSVTIRSVVFAESSGRLECDLVAKLQSTPSVTVPAPGLGASDCRRGCRSHLLLFPSLPNERVEEAVSTAFKALGLSPRIVRP